MKKKLLFIMMLCASHIMCFAQVKVNSVGNTGMGNNPDTKARLLLYNSKSSLSLTDNIFGLHATTENTSDNGHNQGNLRPPLYGIYSINNNKSYSAMYGAYFENKQLNSTSVAGPTIPLYGIYLDNTNSTYTGTNYGVYVKNATSSYTGVNYGFYVNNSNNNYGGTAYGLYSNNTASGYGATLYGVYSINTHQASNGSVYGVYSSVSGAAVNNRYAGYFTGGKVLMTNAGGSTGLDVQGDVWANNFIPTSDERLKTDIKPLSDEKDKLYLLQGKSYKKKTRPIASEEDSLAKGMEIIEMPEYGYLAQELKEIFPDLVKQSQDSAGYYGVNYIGLIPVIVEALKDQRSEIEKQREQIKQLVKLIDVKSINKEIFEENGIESIPLLLQNTPNPFNQLTEIGYYIPENVNSANIYIYDINGFQQRNISITERGKGATTLQASALQAGIYFYTLICDGKPVDTKQMILTK